LALGQQREERMALMPNDRALGVKAGHRVSFSRDSAWYQRPCSDASMQGPSPVAY